MTFNEWFNEPEGFSTRGERIMDMESIDALRATWDAATAEAKKSRALIGLPVIDPSMLARHTLSPADTIPHTPCKSCAGTCIGEQDGERLISRCVQCRREAA